MERGLHFGWRATRFRLRRLGAYRLDQVELRPQIRRLALGHVLRMHHLHQIGAGQLDVAALVRLEQLAVELCARRIGMGLLVFVPDVRDKDLVAVLRPALGNLAAINALAEGVRAGGHDGGDFVGEGLPRRLALRGRRPGGLGRLSGRGVVAVAALLAGQLLGRRLGLYRPLSLGPLGFEDAQAFRVRLGIAETELPLRFVLAAQAVDYRAVVGLAQFFEPALLVELAQGLGDGGGFDAELRGQLIEGPAFLAAERSLQLLLLTGTQG